MGYAEEEYELHVENEIRRVWNLVEGSRRRTEYGMVSRNGGVEAKKVAEDESEDGRADSKHYHKFSAVDEYLTYLEDLDLLPFDVKEEEAEGEEEQSFADVSEHQAVDQWEGQ